MALIDIGAEAKDRGGVWSKNYTLIGKDNPANASGTITSIEIWAASSMTICRVGTFYTTNGNTLKCRDSAIIGEVADNAKRTFTEDSKGSPLAITVESGDYIGMIYETGSIERDLEGYAGLWSKLGAYIDPGDEAAYGFVEGDAISLYGTGETPPGWTGKVSGVTNPAKVMGVDIANIAKVKGVASA
ncbi:hypothetical protein ES708_28775 [subsurface metagenome]